MEAFVFWCQESLSPTRLKVGSYE